ncbi:hypothetical protein IFO70_18460 [Phormidium tenue FACHB-886]|nr:hypothetical protein [Phormidium tenue FACHB-886]
MKSSNFSPDFLLFKPENATSEIVSAKALRPAQPSRLRHFWERLLTLLSGRTEPQIWRKRDRAGNWYFQVFDPATGELSMLGSEQEVRIWIEQRYYADYR